MIRLDTRARASALVLYLCPLSELQLLPAVLEGYLEALAMGQQPLTRITRLTATGKRQHIADGYERLERLSAEVAGHRLAWTERRLVVRSRQRARAGETALRARLAKALAAVAALNERERGKPRFTELPRLREAVEAILSRYRVQGLLAVRYMEQVREHPSRRYGNRPATVQVERDLEYVRDRCCWRILISPFVGEHAYHVPPKTLMRGPP